MTAFQSSLKGKVGILTGGSSGFGLEIVRALKGEGARLAVFSMDTPPDQDLRELGDIVDGDAQFFVQDITAKEASGNIVSKTKEVYGDVDFAVINAGFAVRFEKPLLTLPEEEIAEAMRTQFEVFPIAFVTLALAVAREMKARYSAMPFGEFGHRADSGSIVITLSEAALNPLRDDLLAYAAAKTACLSAMRSLAATLGPLNIRVNGIAPGFANTAGPAKFYGRFPEIRRDVEAHTHLKPAFMHPASACPAVRYLLTDNYVTGEVLALDGGYNIHMHEYFQG